MPTSPSRRTLLRATAWTAPAVTLVAAAPAHAASTPPPTMTVTWRAASYVGALSDPTPYPYYQDSAALGLDVTVAGGSLTQLVITWTWQRPMGLYATDDISRGGTTWAAQLGDLAPWSRTPSGPPGSTYATQFQFVRTGVTGTIPFLSTWADFTDLAISTALPATVLVTGTYATGTGSGTLSSTVSVARTSTAPYVAGVVGA